MCLASPPKGSVPQSDQLCSRVDFGSGCCQEGVRHRGNRLVCWSGCVGLSAAAPRGKRERDVLVDAGLTLLVRPGCTALAPYESSWDGSCSTPRSYGSAKGLVSCKDSLRAESER